MADKRSAGETPALHGYGAGGGGAAVVAG
jgi:hypothetical protein